MLLFVLVLYWELFRLCCFAFYATLNERVNQSGQVVKTTALQMVGGTFAIGLLLPFLSCKQIFAILASLLGRSRVFDPVSLGLYGLYVYVIKPGSEDNQCFYRKSEF